MYKLVSSAIVLGATLAHAGTQYGDQAEAMLYALRYAGVAPTIAKSAHTYQASGVECTEVLDREHYLSDYRCTVGKTELKDAAARSLWAALVGLRFQQKATTETTITIRAATVSCVVDPALGWEKIYGCTADSIPPNVEIKPKQVAPKDIVQPVKIEKQR